MPNPNLSAPCEQTFFTLMVGSLQFTYKDYKHWNKVEWKVLEAIL